MKDIQPSPLDGLVSLGHPTANPSVNSREVDESLLHVRVRQLHANPVPYVNSLKAAYQPPFHGRIKKADPRALGGCASNKGIKPFPDSRLQQQRRRRFSDLPFHLLGCILLFRAVLCQCLQIIVAIGCGLLGQCSLEQPLRDDIRIAAVGGRGMSIVSDGQPKVPWRDRLSR